MPPIESNISPIENDIPHMENDISVENDMPLVLCSLSLFGLSIFYFQTGHHNHILILSLYIVSKCTGITISNVG